MRSCNVNLTSLILKTFLFFQLLPIVFSCIYLLNGWMPMSVFNRTAKADIVLSAHVIRAYKEEGFRTEAQTYMATVKVFDVYKGRKLVRNIPENEKGSKVYNVTNFGDRKMCYADVMEGNNYILFLTTYKQRLSAKYDDIFGAATRYTETNVQEIQEQVASGLDPWTSWSPCSHSCKAGYQTRRRTCKQTGVSCDEEVVERRSCNTFSCTDAHDVLFYLNVYDLPLGVYQVNSRPGAFNVTSDAKLYAPLSNIYPEYLPHNFAILFSVRFSQNYSGYLFTLSDLKGTQRFAVRYMKTFQNGRLLLEFNDSEDVMDTKSVEFSFKLTDDTWHQYAVSVSEDSVEFYLDCTQLSSSRFERAGRHEQMKSNLMMTLGPYFERYGTNFEGEIEQLTLVGDPTAAKHQCSLVNEERAIKDEEDNMIDRVEDNTTDTTIKTSLTTQQPPQALVAAQWTEWSPCSHTCGRGVQVRTQYCGNDIISDCTQPGLSIEEMRWCYIQPCVATCYPRCENGGVCSGFGTCLCPTGFAGKSCDKAICDPPCMNGGRCVDGECGCPVGYSGKQCQNAICSPSCKHGGQCIQPNYCSCPYGYMPPFCEPICLQPCRHGGRCVDYNKCKCHKGYRGKDCTQPICRRSCLNGGRCIAPNKCSCPYGYTGSRCQKPSCVPPCLNKGRCLYPGVCQCRRGYSGELCEIAGCKKTCKNGGFCSGRNRCACPPGYRGRWCHKKVYRNSCQTTCFNGGRCRKKRCRCRPGFSGKRCQRRECTYESYLIPYTQTYRKLKRHKVETPCEKWNWKTCVETRYQYVLATRTIYRNAYRCV